MIGNGEQHVNLYRLVSISYQSLQDHRSLLRPILLAEETGILESNTLVIKLERISISEELLCFLRLSISQIEVSHLKHHLGFSFLSIVELHQILLSSYSVTLEELFFEGKSLVALRSSLSGVLLNQVVSFPLSLLVWDCHILMKLILLTSDHLSDCLSHLLD